MRKRLACAGASALVLVPSLALARPDGFRGGGFDLHNDVRSSQPARVNHSTTVDHPVDHTNVGTTHVTKINNSHHVTVVDPRYGGRPAWSWNHGVAWAPVGRYWGGGFWGAFAVGAAVAVAGAVIYGSIVTSEHQTLPSYQIRTGTPGAALLDAYQLQQVPCGPAGLVVILGPNSSVVCAEPNARVGAGEYDVTPSTLTLVST